MSASLTWGGFGGGRGARLGGCRSRPLPPPLSGSRPADLRSGAAASPSRLRAIRRTGATQFGAVDGHCTLIA
eukprot:4581459-Pyramimonas_sp.AAC.1